MVSANDFEQKELENKSDPLSTCFFGQHASKNMHCNLERSTLKFGLGSRSRDTQAECVTDQSKSLEEMNSLGPSAVRYCSSIENYRKNLL